MLPQFTFLCDNTEVIVDIHRLGNVLVAEIPQRVNSMVCVMPLHSAYLNEPPSASDISDQLNTAFIYDSDDDLDDFEYSSMGEETESDDGEDEYLEDVILKNPGKEEEEPKNFPPPL